MSEWAQGYVTDLVYSPGFYREMTPGILALAQVQKASQPAALPDQPFRYLELGFGRGFGFLLMAASHPHARFHGIDINPRHVATVQRLAKAADLDNVVLSERSFHDFRKAPATEFDIIALHGIYSWVSVENRREIVRIIQKCLKPGGLVYISYNTLPGWSAVLPLREVMAGMPVEEGMPTAMRVEKGLQFVDQLRNINTGSFSDDSGVSRLIDQIKESNRNYLGHEYFCRDWHPMFFRQVAEELSEARLDYLGSASMGDHFDQFNLNQEGIALLTSLQVPIHRETVRDCLVNQKFRRDMFVRGLDEIGNVAQMDMQHQMRFALITPRQEISLKAQFAMGELTLDEGIYGPVLDELAEGPRTVADMMASARCNSMPQGQLFQVLVMLTAMGHANPALSPESAGFGQATARLNQVILETAGQGTEWPWLASPVTGGGISVSRVEQFLLAGILADQQDPVEHAWQKLQKLNHKLVVQGNMLESDEENLAELRRLLDQFRAVRLPLLQQLGVIPV